MEKVKEAKDRQSSCGAAPRYVDNTKRSCLKIDFLLDKLHNASPTVGPGLSKLLISLIPLFVNNSSSYGRCPDSNRRSSFPPDMGRVT